ncbi:hypothetical protein TC41_3231 [Alicyclobacillus acidocaldarius subsp. acidocaldarius Tc-4-1]|uniref:Uncharacterized protein n=1 Tax=Alicyclobacillus acidocaldarius (strain Tc-4-1) TaxID=1048834 RepID=F8IDR7_ALIAT|nr:hypothetical protein TC41_3231 [Alicyclobacillus acidocaldarius subsp. acidocaldarius Tc-4-1]
MGPPTISADQPAHRRSGLSWSNSRFNGAADDLGGSTKYGVMPEQDDP